MACLSLPQNPILNPETSRCPLPSSAWRSNRLGHMQLQPTAERQESDALLSPGHHRLRTCITSSVQSGTPEIMWTDENPAGQFWQVCRNGYSQSPVERLRSNESTAQMVTDLITGLKRTRPCKIFSVKIIYLCHARLIGDQTTAAQHTSAIGNFNHPSKGLELHSARHLVV